MPLLFFSVMQSESGEEEGEKYHDSDVPVYYDGLNGHGFYHSGGSGDSESVEKVRSDDIPEGDVMFSLFSGHY